MGPETSGSFACPGDGLSALDPLLFHVCLVAIAEEYMVQDLDVAATSNLSIVMDHWESDSFPGVIIEACNTTSNVQVTLRNCITSTTMKYFSILAERNARDRRDRFCHKTVEAPDFTTELFQPIEDEIEDTVKDVALINVAKARKWCHNLYHCSHCHHDLTFEWRARGHDELFTCPVETGGCGQSWSHGMLQGGGFWRWSCGMPWRDERTCRWRGLGVAAIRTTVIISHRASCTCVE